VQPVAITDPDDSRLDDFRHLRDAELRRRKEATFIAEGVLVIRQLLQSTYPVRSLLVTAARLEQLAPDLERLAGPDRTVVTYVASPAILEAIAGFDVHRGALASAARLPLPSPTRLLAGARLVVVAEGINDHENLGALFRNAAAFGVDAVLLCPRCADPLYRRSIRVSLGHVLHLPFARLEPWPDGLESVTAAGLRLVALTPDRDAVPVDRVPNADAAPVAVLVGAEGPGLSGEARAAAGLVARIPMHRSVDSLNVATATAIALHRLAPRW
jgi:tRNA G18 (ribose-2'-O)-methylase SpoU